MFDDDDDDVVVVVVVVLVVVVVVVLKGCHYHVVYGMGHVKTKPQRRSLGYFRSRLRWFLAITTVADRAAGLELCRLNSIDFTMD